MIKDIVDFSRKMVSRVSIVYFPIFRGTWLVGFHLFIFILLKGSVRYYFYTLRTYTAVYPSLYKISSFFGFRTNFIKFSLGPSTSQKNIWHLNFERLEDDCMYCILSVTWPDQLIVILRSLANSCFGQVRMTQKKAQW